MQPGIHIISNEEYHSSEGISRSDIMLFKRSPRHFWHKKINPNYVKPEPSPEMRFGEAVHTALLEPAEFGNRYVVSEKFDRRTKQGKLDYEAMLEKTKGKILLEQDDMEQIWNMEKELSRDSLISKVLTGGKYENSIYWIDPDTQLLCKVRPDIIQDSYIGDYKTTRDASFEAFQRDLYNYGYYIQAAMIHEAYKHVLKREMTSFVYVAQEKVDPYLAALYQLDVAALEKGIEEFHKYLWLIKEATMTNVYPGYPVQVISLPAWSK